jgi:hypothetical protein
VKWPTEAGLDGLCTVFPIGFTFFVRQELGAYVDSLPQAKA